MTLVTNPILPGFHPDPSILRVGEWYYIANSTFEWWPGVRFHRSRNLAHWEPAGYALTKTSQIDLRGCPDSGGVWAPCLSYADGRFWLIYSDVKSFNKPFKDVKNYLVTAESIEGPWSDPVFLNSSGFDPSLFHDDDGKKWLVNQIWDPRPDRNAFAGIALQEYCPVTKRLIGDPSNVFRGSHIGLTEGPHIYKKDGWYYLVTAEGGTIWTHAITVARSRTLHGPYQLDHQTPLLTARKNTARLQKCGHGSFVQSSDGHWYVAYLCGRPLWPSRRCILGRETALQPFRWDAGDWPRLLGTSEPVEQFHIEGEEGAHAYISQYVDEFKTPCLGFHWNTLREPPQASWLSLSERPGSLVLRGRHSLMSTFEQSLIGFRLLHHRCLIETMLEFDPRSYQQTAGLSLYYNTGNFYYAAVTCCDDGQRVLRVFSAVNRQRAEHIHPPLPLLDKGTVCIRAEIKDGLLSFSVAQEDGTYNVVVSGLDATTLSDDAVIEGGSWGFTGTFAALCAQDSGDSGIPAIFNYFHYLALP